MVGARPLVGAAVGFLWLVSLFKSASLLFQAPLH